MADINDKDSDLLLGVLDHCDRIRSCVELKEDTIWNTIQNDIPAIEQKIKLILTESGVDVD